MIKEHTVIVGILAYNEESNIQELISNVSCQIQNNYHLDKIVVISDGSTDNTCEEAKKGNKNVAIINHYKRKGVSFRQNELFRYCDSDILVVLNADILLPNDLFLSRLIKPVIDNDNVFTCARACPLSPNNMFEKFLYFGELTKTEIIEKYKKGHNFFTFRGTSKAFSKKIYKKINIPKVNCDDAYIYLYAKSIKATYKYVKSSKLYFKLPSTFSDYRKQNYRFLFSKRLLSKYFSATHLSNSTQLPVGIVVKTLIKKFLSNPLFTVLYGLVFVFSGLINQFRFGQNNELWEISKSTKNLSSHYETNFTSKS